MSDSTIHNLDIICPKKSRVAATARNLYYVFKEDYSPYLSWDLKYEEFDNGYVPMYSLYNLTAHHGPLTYKTKINTNMIKTYQLGLEFTVEQSGGNSNFVLNTLIYNDDEKIIIRKIQWKQIPVLLQNYQNEVFCLLKKLEMFFRAYDADYKYASEQLLSFDEKLQRIPLPPPPSPETLVFG